MDVSFEEVSALERSLTIELPAAQVDVAVENKLKETASNIKINGFREGKVPLREVKRRYGKSIRLEVVSTLVETHYPLALQQKEIAPATAPKIELIENKQGTNLKFKAVFEVLPVFSLQKIDQIKIETPQASIEDSDIDLMIEKVREQQTQWQDKEGAAEQGDQVTINFLGSIDSVNFEGGKGENYELVLGSGSFIDNFEDQLIGLKPGESKRVEVTFPTDYQSEELAGKAASFEVDIIAIKFKELKPVDEDFIKSFGVDSGDLAEFRTEVRNNMIRELEKAVERDTREQLFEGLVELNPIDVPKGLVDAEIIRQKKASIQQFSGGADIQDDDQLMQLIPNETFEPQSIKTVQLALLLGQFIEESDLNVTEQQVDDHLAEISVAYDQPEAFIDWCKKQPQQMDQIKSSLIEKMAIDKLTAQANVSTKQFTYQQVIEGKFGRKKDEQADTAQGDSESGSDHIHSEHCNHG